MAKITRSIGTGMTERAVVEFDHRNPDDVAAQVNAAVTALDMSSFARLSRRLTEHAVAILEAVELPSNPAAMYKLRGKKDSSFIDPAIQKDVDDRASLLVLDEAITAAGFEIDSAEGYAGRVLTKLHLCRVHLQAGEIDDAMALAFEIGALVTEASMKEVFERDFLTGEKVHAGGRKGHLQAHGSAEDKEARRVSQIAAFEAARVKGYGKMAACEIAAEECDVSAATIRRAVWKRTSS